MKYLRRRWRDGQPSFLKGAQYYFYYSAGSRELESEFGFCLRRAPWLETSGGFRAPSQCFCNRGDLRQILGNEFDFLEMDLPDGITDYLDVRREATVSELLSILRSQTKTGTPDLGQIEAIYDFFGKYAKGESLEELREAFHSESLIFHGGVWRACPEAIWADRGDVFGDEFLYLEKAYPNLREFFVGGIGVRPDVDEGVYRDKWLDLQEHSAEAERAERMLSMVYLALSRIAKQKADGKEVPEWWSSLVEEAEVWTRSDRFADPRVDDVFIPDDRELAQMFQTEGAELCWLPDSRRRDDICALLEDVGARRLSNAVSTRLAGEGSAERARIPKVMTVPFRRYLLACMAHHLGSRIDQLLEEGRLEALMCSVEVHTTGLEVIYEAGYSAITRQRAAHWDVQERRLWVDTQVAETDQDVFTEEVAEAIAKGLFPNSPYKDVARDIEWGIGKTEEKVRRRLDRQGWHVPRDLLGLLELEPSGDGLHEEEMEADEEAPREGPARAEQGVETEPSGEPPEEDAVRMEHGDEEGARGDEPSPDDGGSEEVREDPAETHPQDGDSATGVPDEGRPSPEPDGESSEGETSPDGHSREQHATPGERPDSEPSDTETAGEGEASDARGSGSESVREGGRPTGRRFRGAPPRQGRGPRLTGRPHRGRGSDGRTGSQERGKLRTYVGQETGDDADREPSESANLTPRQMEIAEAAVATVLRFERDRGRRPEEMPHNNPGYDVASYLEGQEEPVRFIEVKGIDGEWDLQGVGLSKTQFQDAAQTWRGKFWLYVVENALSPDRTKVYPIRDPFGKANEFRFDDGWAEAAEEEPVRPRDALCPQPGMIVYLSDGSAEGKLLEVVEKSPALWLLKVETGAGEIRNHVYNSRDGADKFRFAEE